VPATALGDIAGDPQDPLPGIGRGVLVDELTEAAVNAYVDLAGPGVESPLTFLEIRHLGGSLRRATPDPGAIGPLDSEAIVYGLGTPMTPELGAAIGSTLDAIPERFAPWISARRTLPTFDEDGLSFEALFGAPVAARLASTYSAYDPDGMFVPTQSSK
jgi:hypothetical protein